jgi:protein MpaA
MVIELIKEIKSQKGNAIQLFEAENLAGGTSSTVLVIGVFHGDEPEGEYLIQKLMEDIKQSPALIGNNRVLLVPCLNPDGRQAGTRVNASGVDLNRNFPTKNRTGMPARGSEFFGGEEPGSEIETRFIIEILDEYQPARILTIHAPYKVVNYDGPAEKIAENMSKLNGYPIQVDIGYPTPGSFGTYAGKGKGIPVITLELPEDCNLETAWLDNKRALYYFISS